MGLRRACSDCFNHYPYTCRFVVAIAGAAALSVAVRALA